MSRWMVFFAASAMIAIVTYLFGMAGDGATAEDWKIFIMKVIGGGTMLWLHWAWSK